VTFQTLPLKNWTKIMAERGAGQIPSLRRQAKGRHCARRSA